MEDSNLRAETDLFPQFSSYLLPDVKLRGATQMGKLDSRSGNIACENNSSMCYNPAMKRELMDILACPVCKGELELSVEEENEREIVRGSLYCQKCDERYPIEDTIPNLLPPEHRN